MYDPTISSGGDSFLVGIAYIGILLATFFRLDEIVATPKNGRKVRRSVSGVDENGEIILSDPDGRVVPERRPRK